MKIKTCPNCGSTNIGADKIIGIVGIKYKCGTCGYSGDIIIERDVDKNFKE